MSTVVAIDLSEREATFVTAETEAEERIRLIDVRRVPLAELLQTSTAKEAPEDSEEEDRPVEPAAARLDLEEYLEQEIDSTVATITARSALFERIELPFNDRKRLEQVVPIQIQDLLPFDLDDFVIDSVVTGNTESGEYEILSSLIPESDVSEALSTLESLGADPKRLTTKGSAITALPKLCPDKLSGTFALIFFSSGQCSLAIFVNDSLKHLREFTFQSYYEGMESNQDVFTNIRCSLAKVIRDHQTTIPVFTIGNPVPADQLQDLLGMPANELDLRPYVSSPKPLGVPLSNIAWALGLLGAEQSARYQRGPVGIDYRQGNYAHKPMWRNFVSALRDETFYIALAVLLGVSWCVANLSIGSSRLGRIETAIEERVSAAVPGVSVPERREVMFMEDRLASLQSQLEELGSLSSLSTLDTLKELSIAVNSNIKVDIASMDIRPTAISFQGSVPDFPSVGRLSAALETRRTGFCKVAVNSTGKVPRSSRVRFAAEITLCD